MSKVTLMYNNSAYPPGTELSVQGIMVKNGEAVEYETDDHPRIDFAALQESFDRMQQKPETTPDGYMMETPSTEETTEGQGGES